MLCLCRGVVTAALLVLPGVAMAVDPVTKPLAALPGTEAGAHLTFNEEFRTLRASVNGAGGWSTTLAHGDRTLPGNDERQFYSDATVGDMPFAIVGGQLAITAAPCRAASPLPYCSGVLTSRGMFFQHFGYFEIRARLPSGRGLWPAFWLLPKGGAWPPELDVLEVLGHEPTMLYASAHWVAPEGGPAAAGKHQSATNKVRTADLSEGFHVFGLSWHPDLLRWYLDGAEVARMPTPPGLDKPMYLLLNLAVGGPKSWPGAPDGSTRFPAQMLVDTVRAYDYAGGYSAPVR